MCAAAMDSFLVESFGSFLFRQHLPFNLEQYELKQTKNMVRVPPISMFMILPIAAERENK